MPIKVLIHVQHLLGTGHQRRAAAIARRLSTDGVEVIYVTGGMPVPGLDIGRARLEQLPPARARDASYRELVDQAGVAVDESWRAARLKQLLRVLDTVRPDVVVIETFPFGRGLLRFELLPMLEHLRSLTRSLRPRPRILCSIRDIVEPRDDPRKYAQMLARAERYFDRILVHSDPSVVAFGATFPLAERLLDRLAYTGYIAPPPPPPTPTQTRSGAGAAVGLDEIVVSAGGGRVGERLLATALAASRHSRAESRRWRILVGHELEAKRFEALRQAAPPEVTVERNRADFSALLARCRVSVSQAGYNTVVDLLGARARAIVVPFSGNGEREQQIRAQRFAERGLLSVLPEKCLAPRRLASLVDELAAGSRPPADAIDLDGLTRTAELVLEAARDRT